MFNRHLDVRGILAGGAVITSVLFFALSSKSTAAQSTSSAMPKVATGHTEAAGADWSIHLGGPTRNHYSSLHQINRSNVAKLQVAWTFETGEKGEWEDNPLIADGIAYIATQQRKVIALDATNGKVLWRFDSDTVRPGEGSPRQRGLGYWSSGKEKRIFTGIGKYLYSIDAKTGELDRSFGTDGSVDLGAAVKLDDVPGPINVFTNSPGLVYKNSYIVCVSGGPGTVQSYDLRTGTLNWVFYTIPRPGEVGYDTWPPDAYKTMTGAYGWSGAALDERRGIVYVPTSQPASTFWGAKRKGANLFANSLVALNADTGKYVWHFQGTHHDVLDRDMASTPPVLLTVMHNGKKTDVVAQGNKIGVLFVLDRVSGRPLWPINEVPVPQSNLPGEQTWPTQPMPTKPKPLMRQKYTEAETSDISPEARAYTAEQFRQVGSYGPYPAPSTQKTIMFPGYDGGMEWGGAAATPDGMYYVNLNEVPWFLQMLSTQGSVAASPGERAYSTQCAVCHGMDRKGNPSNGFPSLVNESARKSRDEISAIIAHGSGRMPAFGTLSQSTQQAIAAFIHGDDDLNVATDSSVAAAHAVEPSVGLHTRGGARGDQVDVTAPYIATGYNRYTDEQGYPAIRPPWGTLNAVDLNTGEIKWKVPLGEYAELTAKGVPPTGTENYGGPIVTAGGLIFIGATADETFRAFDRDTGKMLWKAKLPFGGNTTPSTYMVNNKQYVMIPAGGAKSGRAAGGTLVVFSLPND